MISSDLDALAHGATVALTGFILGVLLFWWLTRSLAGVRPLRPFVTVAAAYGVAAGMAGLWAAFAEPGSHADKAMAGGLIGGALAVPFAFLILLLLPRKG